MQKFFSTEFCFSKRIRPWPILISEMWVHTTKRKHFCICQRQILTLEAAQDEIINKNFTSPELVLPLPSFDQSLQRLPQQAFWRWTIQNLSCGWSHQLISPPPAQSKHELRWCSSPGPCQIIEQLKVSLSYSVGIAVWLSGHSALTPACFWAISAIAKSCYLNRISAKFLPPK